VEQVTDATRQAVKCR